MAIQAVRRALNYAKAMGLIARNPILGIHVGAGKKRINLLFRRSRRGDVSQLQATAGNRNQGLYSHGGKIR